MLLSHALSLVCVLGFARCQANDVLYFTVWLGNGENIAPHLDAIKAHAVMFPGKYKLIADQTTKTFVEASGLDPQVVDLDVDIQAAGLKKSLAHDERSEHITTLYEDLVTWYGKLKSDSMYASASDVLRYMAFSAYSDSAKHLVYHDADVRLEAPSANKVLKLETGFPLKIALMAKDDRAAHSDEYCFIEPTLELVEALGRPQFNNDLLYMNAKHAVRYALLLEEIQRSHIKIAARATVRVVTNKDSGESVEMPLYEAVTSAHADSEVLVPLHLQDVIFRSRLTNHPIRRGLIKQAYVTNLGVRPMDDVLQADADRAYGEFLDTLDPNYGRGTATVDLRLRDLRVKGDRATRRTFITEHALDPASVGAVSRQNNWNWYGKNTETKQDVPVYTWAEYAKRFWGGVQGSEEFDSAGFQGTESSERITSEIGACGLDTNASPRMKRSLASECLLDDQENFEVGKDGEFTLKGKRVVRLHDTKGAVRASVEVELAEKNGVRESVSVTKVLADETVLGLARKRAAAVETARRELLELMTKPGMEDAVQLMAENARSTMSPEHASEARSLGRAYAKAAMGAGDSAAHSAIGAWTAGARAFGIWSNVNMLIHGDPMTRMFAGLDLGRTVNSMVAYELMRHAATEEMGMALNALCENPVMRATGVAASVFFFAQSVDRVAHGHHSATDIYWMVRSSMQLAELVFESLGPVALPLIGVDVLVTVLTQLDYADHVVRTALNSLPLSESEILTLGASAFFGSTAWSSYYAELTALQRVNNRVAQAALDSLALANTVVAFPVTIQDMVWQPKPAPDASGGQIVLVGGRILGSEVAYCAETSEVWPADVSSVRNDFRNVELATTPSEAVALLERYIGDECASRACVIRSSYACAARNKSHRVPNSNEQTGNGLENRFRNIYSYGRPNINIDYSTCELYGGGFPNSTDPCVAYQELVEDHDSRYRTMPVTTPNQGDHLLEPQLKTSSVKRYQAMLISRPVGSMTDEKMCYECFNNDRLERDYPTARWVNGSDAVCRTGATLQCVRSRALRGAQGTLLDPYVFKRASGPPEKNTVLYLNAPIRPVTKASMPLLHKCSKNLLKYHETLFAKSDEPAIIVISHHGLYHGAKRAPNLFVVRSVSTILMAGGEHVDTAIFGEEFTRLTVSQRTTDGTLEMVGELTRVDATALKQPIQAQSVESLEAKQTRVTATLVRPMRLRCGPGSSVVLKGLPRGSTSVIEPGSGSSVRVLGSGTNTVLMLRDRSVSDVTVTVSPDTTLVVRPAEDTVPEANNTLRVCRKTAEGDLLMHGSVKLSGATAAVSLDSKGVMVSCSVAAGEEVYRSTYYRDDIRSKDLTRANREDYTVLGMPALSWANGMVDSGSDEATVILEEGVKVKAERSGRILVSFDNETVEVHQVMRTEKVDIRVNDDPDLVSAQLYLYHSEEYPHPSGWDNGARIVTLTCVDFTVSAVRRRTSDPGQDAGPAPYENLGPTSTTPRANLRRIKVFVPRGTTLKVRDLVSGSQTTWTDIAEAVLTKEVNAAALLFGTRGRFIGM